MAVIKLAWGTYNPDERKMGSRIITGTIVRGVIGVHREPCLGNTWQLTHIPTGRCMSYQMATRAEAMALAKRFFELAGEHDLATIPDTNDQRKIPRWLRDIIRQLKAERTHKAEANA